jgi:hypothetical protein
MAYRGQQLRTKHLGLSIYNGIPQALSAVSAPCHRSRWRPSVGLYPDRPHDLRMPSKHSRATGAISGAPTPARQHRAAGASSAPSVLCPCWSTGMCIASGTREGRPPRPPTHRVYGAEHHRRPAVWQNTCHQSGKDEKCVAVSVMRRSRAQREHAWPAAAQQAMIHRARLSDKTDSQR